VSPTGYAAEETSFVITVVCALLLLGILGVRGRALLRARAALAAQRKLEKLGRELTVGHEMLIIGTVVEHEGTLAIHDVEGRIVRTDPAPTAKVGARVMATGSLGEDDARTDQGDYRTPGMHRVPVLREGVHAPVQIRNASHAKRAPRAVVWTALWLVVAVGGAVTLSFGLLGGYVHRMMHGVQSAVHAVHTGEDWVEVPLAVGEDWEAQREAGATMLQRVGWHGPLPQERDPLVGCIAIKGRVVQVGHAARAEWWRLIFAALGLSLLLLPRIPQRFTPPDD